MIERIAYGHFGREANVLGRHYTADAVLRKIKKAVDVLAGAAVGIAYYTLDNRGGHLLDEVDGVIEIYLVKYLRKLVICKRANKPFLHFGIEKDENPRRLGFRENAEYGGLILFGQIREKLGNILARDSTQTVYYSAIVVRPSK
jgi:hypothetical protein